MHRLLILVFLVSAAQARIRLDLFTPNEGSANLLSRNRGDGTFKDVTIKEAMP